MTTKTLDPLDRKIIGALETDGRRPYREISRELGVPEATVRFRVNRMIKDDFIRITTVGNLMKLGVEVVAITLISVKPGLIDDTADVLATYPNVRFIGTSFGSADILIQSVHANTQALHQFISREIVKATPAITKTETFQLSKVVKSSWDWSNWFELRGELEEPGLSAIVGR